jgi:hypothetical protein
LAEPDVETPSHPESANNAGLAEQYADNTGHSEPSTDIAGLAEPTTAISSASHLCRYASASPVNNPDDSELPTLPGGQPIVRSASSDIQPVKECRKQKVVTPQMLSPVPTVHTAPKCQRSSVLTRSPYMSTLKSKITKPKTKPRARKRLKLTQAAVQNESWYCKICGEDRQEDMVRCVKCTDYIHEACAGGNSLNPRCDLCD